MGLFSKKCKKDDYGGVSDTYINNKELDHLEMKNKFLNTKIKLQQ